jgi:RNA polymerase sigma-70 factor, ECF subfamily
MTAHDDSELLKELLRATARGDRAAFRELYERTGGRLLGIARQLVRRSEVAEEIVQECFVTVWERARDYDARLSQPMTWLVALVRNRSLDLLRRPAVERPIEDEAWIESVPAETASTEEIVGWRTAAPRLAAAMRTLAPLQRQVITLAYYHGLTHSEIAEHVQRPLGTVKTLVRRGLAKLAAALEPAGAPADDEAVEPEPALRAAA